MESLKGNVAGGFVLGLAGEVHQPSRSGADQSWNLRWKSNLESLIDSRKGGGKPLGFL